MNLEEAIKWYSKQDPSTKRAVEERAKIETAQREVKERELKEVRSGYRGAVRAQYLDTTNLPATAYYYGPGLPNASTQVYSDINDALIRDIQLQLKAATEELETLKSSLTKAPEPETNFQENKRRIKLEVQNE